MLFSRYKSAQPTEHKDNTRKELLQSDARRFFKNTQRHAKNSKKLSDLPKLRHAASTSYNSVPSSSNKRRGGSDNVYTNVIDSYLNSLPQETNSVGGSTMPLSNDLNTGMKKTDKASWTLQSYDGLIDALESGHKVYFTAKTKKCQHTGAKKREKTFFGDYVDMYEIQKDFTDKEQNRYLQFTHRRTQYTRKGNSKRS